MGNLRSIDCEHYSACLDRAAKKRGKFNCEACVLYSCPEAREEGFEHELNGKGTGGTGNAVRGTGGTVNGLQLSVSAGKDQEARMETQAEYKPTSKKCTKCGDEKKFSEFSHSEAGKYGYRSICRACDREFNNERNLKKRMLKNAKLAVKPDPAVAPGSTVLKKLEDKARATRKGGTDKPSLSVEHSADGKGGTDKLRLSVEPAADSNGLAKILAEEHWAYIRSLLVTHGDDGDPDELAKIEFHYKSAMIHGYKHGQESVISKQ